jgi:hypothetical protein
MIHGGVRWKRWSCSTLGCTWGTNWIADAPVPIAATRSPPKSWSWSQVAEWKAAPSKLSAPGMSGIIGLLSAPVPRIRSCASRSPPFVWIRHRRDCSSQAASSSSCS